MHILSPQQMDALTTATPVAIAPHQTPDGAITVTLTPFGDNYVVASTPFEVIGAPESYPSLTEGMARFMECSKAVSEDRFPPAARGHQQKAAA